MDFKFIKSVVLGATVFVALCSTTAITKASYCVNTDESTYSKNNVSIWEWDDGEKSTFFGDAYVVNPSYIKSAYENNEDSRIAGEFPAIADGFDYEFEREYTSSDVKGENSSGIYMYAGDEIYAFLKIREGYYQGRATGVTGIDYIIMHETSEAEELTSMDVVALYKLAEILEIDSFEEILEQVLNSETGSCWDCGVFCEIHELEGHKAISVSAMSEEAFYIRDNEDILADVYSEIPRIGKNEIDNFDGLEFDFALSDFIEYFNKLKRQIGIMDSDDKSMLFLPDTSKIDLAEENDSEYVYTIDTMDNCDNLYSKLRIKVNMSSGNIYEIDYIPLHFTDREKKWSDMDFRVLNMIASILGFEMSEELEETNIWQDDVLWQLQMNGDYPVITFRAMKVDVYYELFGRSEENLNPDGLAEYSSNDILYEVQHFIDFLPDDTLDRKADIENFTQYIAENYQNYGKNCFSYIYNNLYDILSWGSEGMYSFAQDNIKEALATAIMASYLDEFGEQNVRAAVYDAVAEGLLDDGAFIQWISDDECMFVVNCLDASGTYLIPALEAYYIEKCMWGEGNLESEQLALDCYEKVSSVAEEYLY